MTTPRWVGPPPRTDTPSEQTGKPRRARPIPDDLLRDASRRLGILALLGAVLWLVGTVLYHLALIPRRYRGALLSKPWLKVNRFEDIAGLWIEQLPAGRRLELLTALALADPAVDLLVVDSPDRHSADPAAWLPRLQALASDAGRPLAVVGIVSALPDNWTGPAAVIGNSVRRPAEPEAEPTPESTEPVPTHHLQRTAP